MKKQQQIISKPDLIKAKKRNVNSQIIYNENVFNSSLLDYARNKKYLVRTFGCQANVRDGETIAGILESIGYTLANNVEEADLVILNTCAVRENAEDRVFGEAGHLKGIKQIKPNAIYAICGCMVQQEAITQKILETYRHIDLIFGTHNIHHLPQLLLEVITNSSRVVEVLSQGDVIENLPAVRVDKLKAFVNIMYGCDKFCTYCIVPYTRGKQRSRTPNDILKEIQELADKGYVDITLLGQNVNAYGKDLNLDIDFADLLLLVSKIQIPRIRFVTSHPWDFTDKLVDVIRNTKNVMNYIHLPFQSGDDEVLKQMGRRYTAQSYYELYSKLRSIPNISITTDIIVGFPNETIEAFNNTLLLVDKCQFDAAYTFIYSKREGTPASVLPDNISQEEKHQRLETLIHTVSKYGLLRNQAYVDKVLDVLVEGVSKRNKDILSGYSEENKLVNFKGNIENIGKIVKVLIHKAKTYTLEGIEVNE